jgi:hypothetical protein
MSSPTVFEGRSWYKPEGCLLDFVGEAEGRAGRVVDLGTRLFHCLGRRRFVGTVVVVIVDTTAAGTVGTDLAGIIATPDLFFPFRIGAFSPVWNSTFRFFE